MMMAAVMTTIIRACVRPNCLRCVRADIGPDANQKVIAMHFDEVTLRANVADVVVDDDTGNRNFVILRAGLTILFLLVFCFSSACTTFARVCACAHNICTGPFGLQKNNLYT